MKEVVLRIDDAAFEKFMGMVSLCPMVEVVEIDEAAVMDGGAMAVRIREAIVSCYQRIVYHVSDKFVRHRYQRAF